MAREYNTHGYADDPLNNASNETPESLLGLVDGFVGQILFGDPDWSSKIAGELTGYNAQQREFEQQEYMTDKQNQWNSAQEQMRRAKEAGINPLTAAGGIAGSAGAASVPQVPSNAGGAAAGLQAAVGAVDTIGTLGSRNALSRAQAQDIQVKQDPSVQNILADTFKKYKEAGYTDIQAQGLAVANAFLPTEKFLGIVAMNANIDVLRAQYKNLMKDIAVKKARISEINKHIQEMGASISLMEKQALTEEARKLQIEAETAETNWFNQKRQELDIDPKSPLQNQLFMMGVTCNPDYDKGLSIVYDAQYKRSYGDNLGKIDAEFVRNYVHSWADYTAKVGNIIGGAVSNVVNGFKNLGNSPKASSIRKELNMVLQNCFDQLEKYPDDSSRIQEVIDQTQSMLLLNNTELVKAYKELNK